MWAGFLRGPPESSLGPMGMQSANRKASQFQIQTGDQGKKKEEIFFAGLRRIYSGNSI